ncbi:hypothetical protein [Nocardioides sp.]|uniref:hypothetical protein n=1 Tax=Nocardioides sp. TaxID=35761 RepID=UPI0026297628|nr:hypothetical protein [Nocardioides sp.]
MSDHDPFETFKATMSTSGTLHPLPAHEVRRRGDRLRRRNTALAVAGGTVAALVAVGVPVALTQTGGSTDGDAGLVATQGPSTDAVAWRVDIPADFPLVEGLPDTNVFSGTPVEAREGYEPQAPGPCRGEAWDVTGSLDVLQAVFQDTEGGIDRSLAVFADDTEAAARIDAMAEQAATCRDTETTVVPLTSDLGEQSLVFANVWEDGQTYLHQAVRVGNAVLYTTSFSLGGGDPAVLEDERERSQDRDSEVIAQMCTFSADPC